MGTTRKTFRLPDDLLRRIDRQWESLRWRSPRPPYDLSDVVRRALEDWLAKYERSCRHRRPRKRAAGLVAPPPATLRAETEAA